MRKELLIIVLAVAAIALGAFGSEMGQEPLWLQGLREEDAFLDFSSCVLESYYCDSCGGARPLSEATTWEGPGRSVRTLKVRCFEQSVIFLLELSEDDVLGPYNYCMGFQHAGHGIWVHLNAEKDDARVEHTYENTGYTVRYLGDGEFVFGTSWVACRLADSVYQMHVPPSAVRTAWFSVALETVPGSVEESFRFPEDCAIKGEIDS